MFTHNPTVSFIPLIIAVIKLIAQIMALLITLRELELVYALPLTTQYKYNKNIKKAQLL